MVIRVRAVWANFVCLLFIYLFVFLAFRPMRKWLQKVLIEVPQQIDLRIVDNEGKFFLKSSCC